MKRMSQNETAMMVAENMNKAGLGYGIAIAVGILVLVSTIMLASYVCVRVHGRAGVGARGGGLEAGNSSDGGRTITESTTGAAAAASTAASQAARGGGGDEIHGVSVEWARGGLDEATLESYPKFIFSNQKHKDRQDDADISCSICLADYRDGELLRLLPDCLHSFHVQCIDAWLRLHASCPMCRTSPLPTPISTPLSELIPLARHPLQSRYTTHHR